MVIHYLDSGSLRDIEKYAPDSRLAGFTPNPTLIKQAGVTNYRAFAKSVLGVIGRKDVSFEVLADSEEEMYAQAMTIAGWGKNVYVKVPVFFSDGTTTEALIKRLAKAGVKLNVTAVLSQKQGMEVLGYLSGDHIVSVFAGRVMDVGRDARSIVQTLVKERNLPMRILWASVREVYNILQASRCADIVTIPPAIYEKWVTLTGKQLRLYSLETCRQFYADGKGIEF